MAHPKPEMCPISPLLGFAVSLGGIDSAEGVVAVLYCCPGAQALNPTYVGLVL